MQKVEVYLTTRTVQPDYEKLFHGAAHTSCAPDLLEDALSGFRGRIFSEESHLVLPALERAIARCGQTIRIHDTGTLRGRLKALVAGISETPAVLVEGQRFQGYEEARQALRGLGGQ
jgi:hypothetical protein